MKIPTIRFIFDRKHVSTKTKKGAIELAITYNYHRKFISTGVRCYSWQWDDTKSCVKGTPDAIILNSIIATMHKKALQIIQDMVEAGRIDIAIIPTMLKDKSDSITFLEYVRKAINKSGVTIHARKSYEAFYNKLAEFGRIATFHDINEKNIQLFDDWLHLYERTTINAYRQETRVKYRQSTIWGFHKYMKKFINEAIKDGHLSENPYIKMRLKINKGEARIDKFLTIEEVRRLENAVMPTASLKEARDLFLFACYTGLSYVDLMTFNKSNIRTKNDTTLYSGTRHKTNIPFTCVLPEKALAILEEYDYHLPTIPNAKYNMKLKVVADIAHIDKPISSHYARHSAAMLWLNEGIPIEIVSRCLGHSNIQQTQKAYATILDDTIIKAFNSRR